MKKIKFLVVIIIMYCNNIFAQTVDYKDLNAAQKGRYSEYVSKDGSVYQVGGKLEVLRPSFNKEFTYIKEGDGVLIPYEDAKSSVSGKTLEIKKIMVVGRARTGYSVTIVTKGVIALLLYSVDLENAISAKEIKSYGKTSEEAMVELKSAKDKLDLELISKEEFENVKKDLLKYIN